MDLHPSPVLESERLWLRLGRLTDIASILRYYTLNRAYLEPFEPDRPYNFYTTAYWEAELSARVDHCRQGRSLRLFIFEKTAPTTVIGVCNLSNIVWGCFQAGTLGYSLAAHKQGQGYMTEAAGRLIQYAFEELNLHRIMANYMPHNHRSRNVLYRLGFQVEGEAKNYLFINGQWQDHILTSLINSRWRSPQ